MRGMGAGMRRARLGRERREWRCHPHLREETRLERGWAPWLGGARGTAGDHGTGHSGDTREPRGPLGASGHSCPHALTVIYEFPAHLQLPTPLSGSESLHNLPLKTVPSAGVGRASLCSWSTRTGAGRAVPFPEAATEDTRSGSRNQELPALLPDPPPLSQSPALPTISLSVLSLSLGICRTVTSQKAGEKGETRHGLCCNSMNLYPV